MKIISFDIDGTILGFVDNAQSYVSIFKDVCIDMFNISDIIPYMPKKVVGMTDQYIFKSVIQNITHFDDVISLYDEFVQKLTMRFETIPENNFVVTKGVVEILDKLYKRSDTILLISSGNIPSLAKIKLQKCNLIKYFVPNACEVSYGCSKSEIVSKVKKYALSNYGEIDTFIHIGDTKEDYLAAVENDAIPILITQQSLDKELPKAKYSFRDFEEAEKTLFELLDCTYK